MKVKDRMVWVELVTSSDDPETGAIERIHAIVTDKDLAVVAEGPPTDVDDLAEVQRATIALISAHVGKGAGLLAGAQVRDVRRFLANQMPELSSYLHYRTIDVSTVRELVRRWYPDAHDARPTGSGIVGAIEELRHYRATVFAPPEAPASDAARTTSEPDAV